MESIYAKETTVDLIIYKLRVCNVTNVGGYLSRQVVFRYDVSLLKAQTEVWCYVYRSILTC